MSSKVSKDEKGKVTISYAPDYINLEEEMVLKFTALARDEKFLNELHLQWHGEKPRTSPKIHIGPSATGPAVIADSAVFGDIRKNQHRQTIGLEMEAYGVYFATRKASRPKPMVFSAKSVCDYASFLKDDRYQKYAAYVSASVVVEFLQRYGKDITSELK